MRFLGAILVLGMFIIGCKKDPGPPVAALLVAPARNQECTPITSESNGENVVRFVWEASANTDTYQLRVTNLETNAVETRTIPENSATVTIAQAAPFSWSVTSRNGAVSETAKSDTWFFYSPGALTSFAPFPAEIIAPPPGGQVIRNGNGEVSLQWSGRDLDDDIERYEVYLSTSDSEQELIASPTAVTSSFSVAVEEDVLYYWRIVTKDREGNTSDTGVLSFKAL
ncbi:hypothetical protein [Maribacter sp. 2-571]|uniref:hypothetical protein n=1 Tax=Maribacter sp. 2-571 TaxID=3417569 RepID=UPI003D3391D4